MIHRLFHATLDTRNFSFEAYGSTEAEAREAMRNGLAAHVRAYRLIQSDFDAEYADHITVRAVALGAAYRDGERIGGAK